MTAREDKKIGKESRDRLKPEAFIAMQIKAIVGVEIEPSETQAVLAGIHLAQLLGVMTAGRLPLGAALRGTTGLEQDRTQAFVRLLTQLIKPCVEPVEIGLLGSDVIIPCFGGRA